MTKLLPNRAQFSPIRTHEANRAIFGFRQNPLYLLVLAKAPKGLWLTRQKLKKNADDDKAINAKKLDAKKSEIEQIIDPLDISGRSPEERFAYAKEKIFKAIDYAIRRHDWYEDQRSRIFRATLSISSIKEFKAVSVLVNFLVFLFFRKSSTNSFFNP